MFTVLSNSFIRYLEIKNPIDESFFTEENIRYFDNDGFQLSILEQEYYKNNNIALTDTLNRMGDRPQWMDCSHEHFCLDHSMTPQRWCYTGAAKEQLRKHLSTFPSLLKYINLRPKWGLDFALEYYNGEQALEVLHIELDFRNYYIAIATKAFLENKINNTNWDDFKNSLLRRKSEWDHLEGMDQNDWKARFWGLDKAEATQKVI
jgi:hypothetical protein